MKKMQVIKSPHQMQKLILKIRKKKRIGFVPTMGFLHEGHLELIRCAKKKSDFVVVSIFVNPKQFGPNEDFKKYPRDTKSDLQKLKKLDVDVVFLPTHETMYPVGFQTSIQVTALSKILCGTCRPEHFSGVTTVVMKLFQIVQPHLAFFGQKDFQQLVIIKKMVEDLHLPIKIHCIPIVREQDGLALSSRNAYLSPKEHQWALGLYLGLNQVRQSSRGRHKISVRQALRIFCSMLPKTRSIKIDYVSCVDKDTLAPMKTIIKNKTVMAVAVWIGKTRLIDNIHL